MVKYLVFLNDNNTQFQWPDKCIEIDAADPLDAYSQISEKSKVAFITVSEDDPTYEWHDGQVYSKYYLENPDEYKAALDEVLNNLPF